MDQSKSNNNTSKAIELPKRSFSLEFFVGIFTILGILAAGYLSIGLGGLSIFDTGRYTLMAEFDNISGLEEGASVEIAGVPVGEVADISLNDSVAIVTMKILNHIKIKDDDIAAIRTKGIIGDRYVKISRGASDIFFEAGDTMSETESVVDFEDIVGKIVHSLTDDDEGDN